MRRAMRWLAVGFGFALAGCSAAPALTAGGESVRLISESEASKCKLLRYVRNDGGTISLGKDAADMKPVNSSNVRNAVAAIGANAFLVTRSDGDRFAGTVDYQGEAYDCPAP